MLTSCQGKLHVGMRKNDGLEIARRSARLIGDAIGILMSTRKITDDAACDLLAAASQTTNRKLRDIADEILLTGELDVAPEGCVATLQVATNVSRR